MTAPIDLLRRALPDLPPGLRAAGQFLTQHEFDAATRSMRGLAAAAGLNPASFTRLAQALGYTGWDDLRDALIEARRPAPGAPFSARLATGAEHPAALAPAALAAAAARADAENLAQLDTAPIAAAAAALHAAPSTWIAGFRSCRAVAELLRYQLRLFRPDAVHLVGGAGPEDLDYQALRPGDAFVIIGFAPYSRASIVAARAAHQAGCTVIAIADATAAPIAETAAHLLLFGAATPAFFPSLTGAIAQAQALAAAAFALGGPAALRRLQQTEARLAAHAQYVEAIPRPTAPSRILHRTLAGPPPPIATGGEGVWIHTADGARVLDASGGAAVSCLGHGHPRIADAIARQAHTLAYAHTGFFSSEPAEALADTLVGHEPGGLAAAYFVSGGSEAMEAALKLARQYFLECDQPARTRFIARRQSYHGNTLGALGAGGNAARRAPYAPLLPTAFSHVSPFAYRFQTEGEPDAAYTARLAAELEAEFQRLGPHTVAAFVAEPVIGATAGCVPPPPGYFQAVRDICDRHGALLILDEVMCGMGRTGTLHAWEQEGIAPDIQTIAKGLGGGYQPIGAVLAKGHVVDAIRTGSGAFQHGHTYLAHPIACAAALEVQRVIAEEDLLARVEASGRTLDAALHDRFGNARHVGDIRGRGLFRGLELVADRATKTPFDPALKLHARIKAAALARGLACYPGGGTIDGARGDHVLLAPPYIVSNTEIDEIVTRLGGAIDDALAGIAA